MERQVIDEGELPGLNLDHSEALSSIGGTFVYENPDIVDIASGAALFCAQLWQVEMDEGIAGSIFARPPC